MKVNYYLIVRDGMEDDEPVIHGPYTSEKKARNEGENEYNAEPGIVLNVISICDRGIVEHETVGFAPDAEAKFNWK